MINLNPKYKKKLEEAVKKLNPDSDEYWETHTIEKIEGINYDIKDGVKIRRADQEKWYWELGSYIWVTNKGLYEKLKKEDYTIIGFHPDYTIPLMFKENEGEQLPDWFAPPIEIDRKKD